MGFLGFRQKEQFSGLRESAIAVREIAIFFVATHPLLNRSTRSYEPKFCVGCSGANDGRWLNGGCDRSC